MSQGFCTAYTPAPVKLSELRAKTDRQLHGLVHSRLDVGLEFAVLAEVEASSGDRPTDSAWQTWPIRRRCRSQI